MAVEFEEWPLIYLNLGLKMQMLVDNVVNNPGQIPDIIQEKITGLEVVLSNLQ